MKPIGKNTPQYPAYIAECHAVHEKYNKLYDESKAHQEAEGPYRGKDNGELLAILKEHNKYIAELKRKYGYVD